MINFNPAVHPTLPNIQPAPTQAENAGAPKSDFLNEIGRAHV